MPAGSLNATCRRPSPARGRSSARPLGADLDERRAEADAETDGPTLLYARASLPEPMGQWVTGDATDPEGTAVWRGSEGAKTIELAPRRVEERVEERAEDRAEDRVAEHVEARALAVVAIRSEPTVAVERSEEKLLEAPRRPTGSSVAATEVDAELRALLGRAEYLDERGLTHLEQAHHDRAWRLHRAALNLRERCLPKAHPLIAVSFNRLAAVCVRRGELREAARWLERARTLELDPEPKATQGRRVHAMTLHNLAAVAHGQGDYAQALDLYTRALELKQQVYPGSGDAAPEQHPSVALTLLNLGNLYRSMDVFADAIACYGRARLILERRGEPAALARVLSCMGRTYLLMAARHEASFALERALELYASYESAARDRAAARFALAQAIGLDDPRRARAEALEVLDELAASGKSRAVERATRQVQRWLFEHARA